MAEPNRHAAVDLLAKALYGISATAPDQAGEEEPTLSASEITQEGDAALATIFLQTGDMYRIEVTWLRERSP